MMLMMMRRRLWKSFDLSEMRYLFLTWSHELLQVRATIGKVAGCEIYMIG